MNESAPAPVLEAFAVPDLRTRKRVGFLSSAATLWGAEQSLLTLVRELKGSEVEPVLVAYEGELAEIWRTEAIGPVVAIAERSPSRLRRNAEVIRAWRTVSRCHTWVLFNFDLLPMITAMRALKPRDRVFLDLHDYLPGRRGRQMLRGLAHTASGVISVSRFVSGQVSTRVPQTVIYRPIKATEPAGPTGAGADAPRRLTVGVVGRIDPEKGHLLAVRAVAALDDVDLVIRGGTAYGHEHYLDDLKSIGGAMLGERLRFEGPVPQAAALDGIDVLVAGNPAEPLGRTVAEAQLRGIPAIVPETGGSAELVRHLETGLTYAAGDPRSLAEQIVLLAGDPGLTRAIVERAAEVARARHAPDAYARDYMRFLRMDGS
jgi:glycosyltransferase involved in cell wall biosynthesis